MKYHSQPELCLFLFCFVLCLFFYFPSLLLLLHMMQWQLHYHKPFINVTFLESCYKYLLSLFKYSISILSLTNMRYTCQGKSMNLSLLGANLLEKKKKTLPGEAVHSWRAIIQSAVKSTIIAWHCACVQLGLVGDVMCLQKCSQDTAMLIKQSRHNRMRAASESFT